MSDGRGDELLCLRELAAQARIAKLRALGREMRLQAELQDARRELDMLVKSRSWKLTRPLRAMTERVRQAPQPQSNVNPDTNKPAVSTTIDSAVVRHGDRDFVTAGKAAWDEAGRRRLEDFLRSDRRLSFPEPAQPAVSIILALYNKAHLGFLCLESIQQNAEGAYELVLVDNASTDNTGELLDRLAGATVIRNSENKGFGEACIRGAGRASGEFLCFLNNDAILCPGSLDAALNDFREDEKLGAVGGKILFADGRLQEAGSIVWQDGTTWGYGRGDDPDLPRYGFRRPVDYCSAAFLLTPRALFRTLGGFDERFLPAYYEDTDYGMKVWDAGLKVLYEPRAMIHHYESASFEDAAASKAAIERNRAKFAEKWRQRLAEHISCEGAVTPYARFASRSGGARILLMGERESGIAGESEFLSKLVAKGHHVTYAATAESEGGQRSTSISKDVEQVDPDVETHYVFRELLSQYDVAWVKGRRNMRDLLRRLWNMDARIAPIVYEPGTMLVDGAAGNAPADIAEAAKKHFEEEVTLCQAADFVLVESDADRRWLINERITRVFMRGEQSIEQVLAELLAQNSLRPKPAHDDMKT